MNDLEGAPTLSLRTVMSSQQQKAFKHAYMILLSSVGIDMASLLRKDESALSCLILASTMRQVGFYRCA